MLAHSARTLRPGGRRPPQGQGSQEGAQSREERNRGARRQQGNPGPGAAEGAGRRHAGGADESNELAGHSVRGFLSGTVGKKLGLTVVSTKGEEGRTYSVKA